MKLLFVCTGNTCRSPMAKCLMDKLAREHGVSLFTDSAGLSPAPGQGASPWAARAMADRGLSLEGHRAKPVTQRLMDWADQVICMTKGHQSQLAALFPLSAGKITVLSQPVQDPFGGGWSEYAACAEQLSRLLAIWCENAGFF